MSINEKELIEKNGYTKYFEQAEIIKKILEDNNIKFKWGTFFAYSDVAYERNITKVNPEKYNLNIDILYGVYGNKCPYLWVRVAQKDVVKSKELLKELDVKVDKLDFLKDSYIDTIPEFYKNTDDVLKNDDFDEKIKLVSRRFSVFNINNDSEILFNNRDELYEYLLNKEIDRMLSYDVMERVRKGMGLSKGLINDLKSQGIRDEKFFGFCNNVRYLVSKGMVIDHLI